MTDLFGKRVIFFGAHTDDEVIAAGTLHRLIREGCEVHVVTFAPAAVKEDRKGGAVSSDIVHHEWMESMSIIGIQQGCYWFDNLQPSIDLYPFRQQICQRVFDYCDAHKPSCVITLSPEDENTAHSVVGIECERVLRGRVPIAIRCLFPWNYGHGRPNLYVSLSPEDMEVKRKAINAYQSQKPKDGYRYDYEQILMSMAIADGKSVKVDAAEKFEIVRSVM